MPKRPREDEAAAAPPEYWSYPPEGWRKSLRPLLETTSKGREIARKLDDQGFALVRGWLSPEDTTSALNGLWAALQRMRPDCNIKAGDWDELSRLRNTVLPMYGAGNGILRSGALLGDVHEKFGLWAEEILGLKPSDREDRWWGVAVSRDSARMEPPPAGGSKASSRSVRQRRRAPDDYWGGHVLKSPGSIKPHTDARRADERHGLQCILMLSDGGPGVGHFVCWPGSHKLFDQLRRLVELREAAAQTRDAGRRRKVTRRSGFMPLQEEEMKLLTEHGIEALRLTDVKAGDLLVFCSDLVHGAEASAKECEEPRVCMYLSMAPVEFLRPAEKLEAFLALKAANAARGEAGTHDVYVEEEEHCPFKFGSTHWRCPSSRRPTPVVPDTDAFSDNLRRLLCLPKKTEDDSFVNGNLTPEQKRAMPRWIKLQPRV